MVDTSQYMRDYVENFRANLPSGVSYNSDVSDYVYNNKRFNSEWEVERYRQYLAKFGTFTNYVANTFNPELVFDFDEEVYGVNNYFSSFSDAITHTRAGNATMVDSDGLLKWAPHNLALNSASPATQSITVVSGANYTVECTGVSIALSGAGTGTVTEGNPVTITASTTTLTLTVTGSTGTMWAYRSDLGGMVNNPDRGDSYVPTTSSAVYLPRRGHHVYNGTSWVNEGLLHESEARTNLILQSEAREVSPWTAGSGVSVSDGFSTEKGLSFALLTGDDIATNAQSAQTVSLSTSTTYSFSEFIKAGTSSLSRHGVFDGTSSWQGYVQVAWTDGVPSTESSSGASGINYENFGDGVYRLSFSFTTDATLGVTAFQTHPDRNATEGTILVSGAQLEEGSTPSSYIPNYGAPSGVTRPAETLTVPAANLPWPTPNVIGDELVTNGTFDTDLTGWTDNSSGSATSSWDASGALSLNYATGESARSYQAISTTSGSVYRLKANYSGALGTTVIRAGTTIAAGNLLQETVSGSGSVDLVFVATSSTSYVNFLGVFSSGSCLIDNVSVREIDPLSVSIQMDGLETFADEGSATQETLFDWRVDANNRITLNLDTDSTKVGTLTLTMVNGSGTDETISTTAELTPGVNDPFNVAIVCTSNEIGIALDGTAETRVSHSIGLPDLSGADATLGGNGTRALARAWDQDITDAGEEAATT